MPLGSSRLSGDYMKHRLAHFTKEGVVPLPNWKRLVALRKQEMLEAKKQRDEIVSKYKRRKLDVAMQAQSRRRRSRRSMTRRSRNKKEEEAEEAGRGKYPQQNPTNILLCTRQLFFNLLSAIICGRRGVPLT